MPSENTNFQNEGECVQISSGRTERVVFTRESTLLRHGNEKHTYNKVNGGYLDKSGAPDGWTTMGDGLMLVLRDVNTQDMRLVFLDNEPLERNINRLADRVRLNARVNGPKQEVKESARLSAIIFKAVDISDIPSGKCYGYLVDFKNSESSTAFKNLLTGGGKQTTTKKMLNLNQRGFASSSESGNNSNVAFGGGGNSNGKENNTKKATIKKNDSSIGFGSFGGTVSNDTNNDGVKKSDEKESGSIFVGATGNEKNSSNSNVGGGNGFSIGGGISAELGGETKDGSNTNISFGFDGGSTANDGKKKKDTLPPTTFGGTSKPESVPTKTGGFGGFGAATTKKPDEGRGNAFAFGKTTSTKEKSSAKKSTLFNVTSNDNSSTGEKKTLFGDNGGGGGGGFSFGETAAKKDDKTAGTAALFGTLTTKEKPPENSEDSKKTPFGASGGFSFGSKTGSDDTKKTEPGKSATLATASNKNETNGTEGGFGSGFGFGANTNSATETKSKPEEPFKTVASTFGGFGGDKKDDANKKNDDVTSSLSAGFGSGFGFGGSNVETKTTTKQDDGTKSSFGSGFGFGGGGNNGMANTSINYKDEVTKIYQKYNPAKLSSVDATLAKYAGKEDKLLEKLKKKICNWVNSESTCTPPNPVPNAFATKPLDTPSSFSFGGNENNKVGSGFSKSTFGLTTSKITSNESNNGFGSVGGNTSSGFGSTTTTAAKPPAAIDMAGFGSSISGGSDAQSNGFAFGSSAGFGTSQAPKPVDMGGFGSGGFGSTKGSGFDLFYSNEHM
eukprot:g3186.t1